MMKIKRILSIALALTLCLAFMAGCGASAPQPTAEPTPAPTPEPTPTPTPAPTPTPTPTPTPEPEYVYPGPDLEEQERMEDDFFEDALFIGNSLVHGFWAYGGIKTGTWCAATSASVVNMDRVHNQAWQDDLQMSYPMLDIIRRGGAGKVYILLGINEIGFEPEDYVELYDGFLDIVVEAHPDAQIYIMGLTPVTEWKDAKGYPFTMERIRSYNEALRQLAADREFWYVDLCEAMAGEDGFLADEDSTDGVHFVREKYPDWGEYLRTHYATEEMIKK